MAFMSKEMYRFPKISQNLAVQGGMKIHLFISRCVYPYCILNVISYYCNDIKLKLLDGTWLDIYTSFICSHTIFSLSGTHGSFGSLTGLNRRVGGSAVAFTCFVYPSAAFLTDDDFPL